MIIIPDDIKNEYVIHISKAELAEALALLSKKDMEAKLYHRVKHGRWKHHQYGNTAGYYECDNCGKINSYESNYCPNCGAKMDLIGEDKSHPFAESVMMGE